MKRWLTQPCNLWLANKASHLVNTCCLKKIKIIEPSKMTTTYWFLFESVNSVSFRRKYSTLKLSFRRNNLWVMWRTCCTERRVQPPENKRINWDDHHNLLHSPHKWWGDFMWLVHPLVQDDHQSSICIHSFWGCPFKKGACFVSHLFPVKWNVKLGFELLICGNYFELCHWCIYISFLGSFMCILH